MLHAPAGPSPLNRSVAVAVFVFVLSCAPASSALAMSAPIAVPANNQTLIGLGGVQHRAV